jgi:suppressor for copper-sensitivity B
MLFTLALSAAAAPRLSIAAASAWVDSDYSQVRLIAVWDDENGLRAGLQFRLDAGWKTYWRSPGDSGIPMRVDWTGSQNITPPALRYPIPQRIESFGYQTLVYQDQVVLPIQLSAAAAGSGVRIRATIDYALCKDICLPLQAVLSLDLAGPAEPGAADKAHARLIERYAARTPSTSARAEMSLASVLLSGPPGRQRLNIVIDTLAPMSAPGLIVEAPPPFSFGAPVFVRRGAQTVAAIDVVGARGGDGGQVARSLAGRRVIITVYDGDIGIERALVVGLTQ